MAKKSKNRTVQLEFTHPEAREVSIAGQFNDWRPVLLDTDGEGHWNIQLELPSGSYEYLFVVDNVWITDPSSHNCVPNPFGGTNSLLVVP
jgi:1,4-alpha-glucan branching enzyme